MNHKKIHISYSGFLYKALRRSKGVFVTKISGKIECAYTTKFNRPKYMYVFSDGSIKESY